MSKEIRFADTPAGPIQVDTLNQHQKRVEFSCNVQFWIELKEPDLEEAAIEDLKIGHREQQGRWRSEFDENKDEHAIVLDIVKDALSELDYIVDTKKGKPLDPRVDW